MIYPSDGRPYESPRNVLYLLTVFWRVVLLYVVSGHAQTGYISVKGSVVNEWDRYSRRAGHFSSSADPRKMVQYDIAASGTFEVSLGSVNQL